jgi:type IV secretion system pilin
MKTMRTFLASSVGVFFALFLTIAFAPVTHAAFDLSMIDGANAARGIDQAVDLFGATGIFTTISNVMLFVVGAISVIMIVIGGLRYVVSGGNTSNVTAAKNTILYAIVGLIISMLAYAAINFVITSFMGGGAGGLDV